MIYDVYNIGNEDWITVKEIADIVTRELGLENVEYIFTGGTENGRGWPGDVKLMLLEISKAKQKGWKPKANSRNAVKNTVADLLNPSL